MKKATTGLLNWLSTSAPKRQHPSTSGEESGGEAEGEGSGSQQQEPDVGAEDPAVFQAQEEGIYPQNDIGNYASLGRQLTEGERGEVLENAWVPPPGFNFPLRKVVTATKQHKAFQAVWLNKYSWLRYSTRMEGGFCCYCVAFGSDGSGVGEGKGAAQSLQAFSRTAWTKYKKTEELGQHPKTEFHRRASARAQSWLAIKAGQADVAAQLDSQRNKQDQLGRRYLRRLLDIILFLGHQGLAFRGGGTTKPVSSLNSLLLL